MSLGGEGQTMPRFWNLLAHADERELLGPYGPSKTQFIADRMKETRWKHRLYIHQLLALESIISKSGTASHAGSIMWNALAGLHPVEARFIERELGTGEVTSADDFHSAVAEARRCWAVPPEDKPRKLGEPQEMERQEWLRLGGLP